MAIFEIFVGLLSSVTKSGKDISNKFTVKEYKDIEIGSLIRYISIFILLPVFLFVPFKFTMEYEVIGLALLDASLILSGGILVSYSIRLSDISLVTPIYALSPIITVIYSIVIIREIPSILSTIGIILVSVGVYLLNIKSVSDSLLKPIKSIAHERGIQIALFTTIYTSIIPVVDKIGINHTSAYTWPFLIHVGMIVFSFPYIIYKRDRIYKRASNLNAPTYFLISMGILSAVIWLLQSIGYSLTNVAYIVALKRTSILLNMVAGHLFFNEKLALSRIPGGILIVAGVIAISLGI